ncbi:unnamed protein product, partial [Onchocerca ochengi]
KDFYLGLPRDEHYRVARLVQPTMLESVYQIISSGQIFEFSWHCFISWFSCEFYKALRYPLWLSVLSEEMPYNNPAVREMENVAVLGIGTARGLANVILTIWKKNLINEEIWKRLSQPVEYAGDKVSCIKRYRGHGFYYAPHPIRQNTYIMLHPGHGKQNLIIDPFNKVVVVLIRNAILWKCNAFYESLNLANDIIRIVDMNT